MRLIGTGQTHQGLRNNTLKNIGIITEGGINGRDEDEGKEEGRKRQSPLRLEQQGALEQSLTAAYFPT